VRLNLDYIMMAGAAACLSTMQLSKLGNSTLFPLKDIPIILKVFSLLIYLFLASVFLVLVKPASYQANVETLASTS